MRQVVQPASGGPVQVIEVPRPSISATEVLVQTTASIISSGTERAVTQLAQSSLLAKARARPDLVRQVIKKARTDGLAQTARTVRSRLAQDVPLGYSAAGVVLEVGEYVAGIRPGQLVATAGAGKANHAEFQAVPGLLCVPIPDGVDPGDAAFAGVASIGLHALRLADVGPGANVVVVGLGLVGQLTARLAHAAGCNVAGIDVAELPLERAQAAGIHALAESGDGTSAAIVEWSRGRGADAVILTASGKSSEPMRRVPALCRDRATVIVVGDVGLDLDRRPLYEKELSIRFARSYGPGRYERSYEEWGVDYPEGYVRWTEGRNLEAVLDLLATGRLRVDDLVTHHFELAGADAAYELIEKHTEPFLAIELGYPDSVKRNVAIAVHPRREASGRPGVGFIGAGAFASGVLVPAFKAAGLDNLVSIASNSGVTARRLAEREGFEKAVSGADAVIDDPGVEVVVIATPHDTHAQLAAKALRAGKHVFCEKPVALTMDELDDVEAAWRDSGRVLFVGFNRRFSLAVATAQRAFSDGGGGLVLNYRVNAGRVPEGHWYEDRLKGGRLVGEISHFIDTCSMFGTACVAAEAYASSGAVDSQTDYVVSLRYANRTLAVISYATGGPAGHSKERLEILGGGRAVVIEDFTSVVVDGRQVGVRGHDKGHEAMAIAFATAVTRGEVGLTQAMLDSSRVTLRVAASISAG